MSRSATLLRNITSNWIGFVVNAAVTLALTPYVLHELGTARYGIWILTSSFIGYYGFLDLGFRAGVTQYLTRYLALRDYERASDCLSSSVVVLTLLGLVMTALSIVGAYTAPHLFSIPSGMVGEAFWCILIVGLSSAVQCVFSPFAAMFTSLQRFDISNLIGIGSRLLTAAGIFAALKTGHGLIGVSIASCGANVIEFLIRWRVALRLAPELDVTWRRAKLIRLREIASFGGWNFLISVNFFIYQYVPNILIGAFMPIAAVGHYALATGLSRQVNSVLSPVPQVVYPAATELHVQNDLKTLENLYHKASRLMILVMIPVVLIAAFWADDFYRLWIGEKYLSGVPFQSVAVIFQILLISTVTCFSSSVAQQIIMGTGRVRLVSTLLIIGSVINLSFSVILIRPYGLAGVAVATVIASVLIDMIAMPFMLQRVLGLSASAFILNSCIRPAAAGLLQAVIMYCIKLAGPAGNFTYLILQGTLAAVGAAAIFLVIGLTKEERHRFLFEPLRRIRKNRLAIESVEP
ncbi:MAG: oligosaccharide flippase family protein [Geobacter sp.]|nr:oligosaccharide flippase family protein [Geobacter sp.]